jgi:hypothetical protein
MKNEASAASLRRRVMFAASCFLACDALRQRISRQYLRDPARMLYGAANLVNDSVETLRSGAPVPQFGRVHAVATQVSCRLPQHPRYRSYWYDPARHSLVGLNLGLDVIRRDGKFHIVEVNLNAALRAERRAVFDCEFDPLISNLATAARAHGFDRVVLFARTWRDFHHEEFARASGEFGVAFVGASSPLHDDNPRHPMLALPEQLQNNTIYVVCIRQPSPLAHMLHNKASTASWLPDAIERFTDAEDPITCIPTFDRIVLPNESPPPNSPNLVVKLASGDRGKFVEMGRFRSVEDAEEALQLRGPHRIPAIFNVGVLERLKDRLLPRLQAIYQPYVVPEVREGRARKIRVHVFISPLIDSFLSAHCGLGRKVLPDHLPYGLIDRRQRRAFVVNFSDTGGYRRAEPEVEDELKDFARAFGRAAKGTLEGRFDVTP